MVKLEINLAYGDEITITGRNIFQTRIWWTAPRKAINTESQQTRDSEDYTDLEISGELIQGILNNIPGHSRTSMVAIEIGYAVTSIGGYAFCDCSGLTSVTIPASVKSIGSYAFA